MFHVRVGGGLVISVDFRVEGQVGVRFWTEVTRITVLLFLGDCHRPLADRLTRLLSSVCFTAGADGCVDEEHACSEHGLSFGTQHRALTGAAVYAGSCGRYDARIALFRF